MTIRLVVASTNPVKRQAAAAALRAWRGTEDHEVRGTHVPSGVPDQPVGDEQTLLGARNRADGARAAEPAADLWVGLEGGIVDRDGMLEAMAWAVVLGSDGRRGESRTATFQLPREIADLVRSGVELGEATDRVLGCTGSKHTTGVVGPLTGGAIDRVAYYTHALVLALVPFGGAGLTYGPG